MPRWTFVLMCFLCFQGSAYAQNDFYDILRHLPIQRPNDVTQTLDTNFYAASVHMVLRDNDGNNANFGSQDRVETLVLKGRGGTLAFPGGSRAELEQFARRNSAQITRIVFPDTIATQAVGQPENQLNASLTFDEVVAPMHSLTQMREKKRREAPLRNELSGRVEYTALALNGDQGDSFAALLSYKRRFSTQFEAGLLLPYRFSTLNDNVNTKTHFLQFDMYGKYTLYNDQDVTVRVGGDAFFSLLASQSDALDVFGNLRYGGGIFAAAEKDFGPAMVTLGVGFKLSQITIPDAFIPDDYRYLTDPINDRALDKDLTYGLSATVPVQDIFAVTLGLHRTNSFSSDISKGRAAQTKIGVWLQYAMSWGFELHAGYSTVLEVARYTPHTVFLQATGRF